MENNVPAEIQDLLNEVGGASIRITNVSLCEKISYGTIIREFSNEELKLPDDRLEYIFKLIKSAFFNRSVLMPFVPQFVLGKEDLSNPNQWNKLVTSVENDFLPRINDIPRNNFKREDILEILSNDFIQYLTSDDRKRINLDKLYFLTLFIYDYVQFSFKEMAINKHINVEYVTVSSIEIDNEVFPSNDLIDDILIAYVTNPYSFYRGKDNMIIREFRDLNLSVPSEHIIKQHPNCNVNNMTAMFYDLYRKFLSLMNFTKRKGATLSDLEKSLIAKLAKACKICNTEKASSVTRMYSQHKDYFLDCKFYFYVRENQYGRLMINNNEEIMFPTRMEEVDNQDVMEINS